MDSSESSPELVEEVIEQEILPRAAVKSLLKFRCASKTWRSLIDSEPFIDKHLVESSTRRNRAIFNDCSRCGPRFSPPYDYSPVDPSLVDHDHDHDHPGDACWYALGHHNGLLCILKEQDSEGCFFLSNPATKIYVQLPDPELIIEKVKLGFGWDEHSGAYKVFLGVPDHDIYHDDDDVGGGGPHDGRIARIYSSETNSWREVEHGSGSLIGKFGVFARGKIYWLTRSGHIEYLDLRNEVFGRTMIGPPSSIKFGDDVRVWLWERKGSLCIVCDDNNRTKRVVWVTKEENKWAEDEGLASELAMEVHGSHGAFPYVETLVSPPALSSS